MGPPLAAATVGCCFLLAGQVPAGSDGPDYIKLKALLPPGPDAQACYARTYDPTYLQQHPQQKVTELILSLRYDALSEDEATLIAKEDGGTEKQYFRYDFTLAAKVRDRTGTLYASGDCASAEGIGCGVDCDGGGIEIEPMAGLAVLTCKSGKKVTARLVVGADGRRSICREAASIAVKEWRYDQAAIATSFRHARPHDFVSTELHASGGSLTTVPFPDAHASSLIFVGATAEIEAFMRLDTASFRAVLEERLGGLLGSIDEVGARASFPVASLSAESLVGPRTALVGEAAHILPPIGAQGLNLGFRDAAALADCVAVAHRRGSDPGGDDVLKAYARARKLDIATRTLGVDLLARSLLTDFLPMQAARSLIVHGLNRIAPLRRLAMRAGLAPPTELPSLMQPVPDW